jgi:glucan phosphoethanolaminetransferase (alkaline phosphatase superfamily)
MNKVLGDFLKKKGWFVLLLILLSPNLVLVLIRLFHGYFFLAFKSAFYLFISFYLFVIPLLVFPAIKTRCYVLLFFPYIIILPLVIFSILLYWQWPTKSIVFVILTASKPEIMEFLKGMWGLKISLLFFYLLTIALIFFSIPPRISLSKRIRFSALSILVLFFLFLASYRSFQANSFVFFSKSTVKRFVKETPVSLAIRSYKSVKLIHGIRKQEVILSERFNPVRTTDSNKKEVYVVVIGESSRYDHWHINGYKRETSPNVDSINNLVSFSKVYSNAVYTNLSVPHMLVPFSGENDFVTDTVPVLIDYFNSAGFQTCWISNQCNNFNIIGAISRRAQKFITLDCKNRMCFDEMMLDELDKLLQSDKNKLFIILHQIGSHYPYHNRYPGSFKKYTPDLVANKHIIYKQKNKEKLVNSYDNSILYTDYFLGQVIQRINDMQCVSSVIYCSDHGESLFDTSNLGYGREIKKSSDELNHVPMFIWMSDLFLLEHPEKKLAVVDNAQKRTEVKNLYYSLLDLADFQIDSLLVRNSFFSEEYVFNSIGTDIPE